MDVAEIPTNETDFQFPNLKIETYEVTHGMAPFHLKISF